MLSHFVLKSAAILSAILISSKWPIVSNNIVSTPASLNQDNVSPMLSSAADFPGNKLGW